MSRFSSDKGTNNVAYAAKTLIISFAATIALIFICAVAAVYTAASESMILLMVTAVTAACVIWGGFSFSKHVGNRGLLCGALLGFLYVVLLYVTGCIVLSRISFGAVSILTGIIGIGCGAVGGVIGVNTKTSGRR